MHGVRIIVMLSIAICHLIYLFEPMMGVSLPAGVTIRRISRGKYIADFGFSVPAGPEQPLEGCLGCAIRFTEVAKGDKK